jgi:polysaccharide transporter, PST family
MKKKTQWSSEKATITSNYGYLLFLQGANYILPLIILPFLVRVLGTEKYGLVMFAQSMAVILSVIVDFGFNLSGTREVSIVANEKKKLSEVFSAILILKIILTAVAFLILVLVTTFFARFSINKEVYILSFGIVIGQAIFPTWFFQGIEKMKVITAINVLAKLIFTALVFVVVKEETQYLLVPAFNSLGFIISGILGIIISFKYVKIVMPKYTLIKSLFKESSVLFFSNLGASLSTTANVLVLGLFTSNSTVGIYSSIEKLIIAAKNIYIPFFQAIYPWLSKQTKQIKIAALKKILPVMFFVGFLINVTILLFGEKILTLIYNNELISSYANVFKIVSFIVVLSAIHMTFITMYFPSGKQYNIRMRILVTGGIINLFLALLLVNLYGIYGTAIACVLTESLLLVLAVYFFKKTTKNE